VNIRHPRYFIAEIREFGQAVEMLHMAHSHVFPGDIVIDKEA